jgi:hypothetical protein
LIRTASSACRPVVAEHRGLDRGSAVRRGTDHRITQLAAPGGERGRKQLCRLDPQRVGDGNDSGQPVQLFNAALELDKPFDTAPQQPGQHFLSDALAPPVEQGPLPDGRLVGQPHAAGSIESIEQCPNVSWGLLSEVVSKVDPMTNTLTTALALPVPRCAALSGEPR